MDCQRHCRQKQMACPLKFSWGLFEAVGFTFILYFILRAFCSGLIKCTAKHTCSGFLFIQYCCFSRGVQILLSQNGQFHCIRVLCSFLCQSFALSILISATNALIFCKNIFKVQNRFSFQNKIFYHKLIMVFCILLNIVPVLISFDSEN